MDKKLPSFDDPVPVEISVFAEGGHYVFRTDQSVPIYSSDKDSPGKSNCDKTCTMMWTPVEAPPDATKVGNWTAIERADKTKQWAYKGKPVYTFIHDQPGQTNGDGAGGGLWHVVKP